MHYFWLLTFKLLKIFQMLSELHTLNLKLCSSQYNKAPDCGATAKQLLVTKLLNQNKAGRPCQ